MTQTHERHGVDVQRRPHPKGRRTEAAYLDYIGDRNSLVELVDRRIVIHPMPTPAHQRIVARILRRLLESTFGQAVPAPMPVRLPMGTIREPDVGFYATAHLDRLDGPIAGPPDLAVEVLSPDSVQRDRVQKRVEYAEAGIGEYWIVDPVACDVLVLHLDPSTSAYAEAGRFAGDDVVTPMAAPDAAVRVGELFG